MRAGGAGEHEVWAHISSRAVMVLAAESDDEAQRPVKSAAYVAFSANTAMAIAQIAHTKIFML